MIRVILDYNKETKRKDLLKIFNSHNKDIIISTTQKRERRAFNVLGKLIGTKLIGWHRQYYYCVSYASLRRSRLMDRIEEQMIKLERK